MNKNKIKFLVTKTIAAKFDAVKDASVKAYYQFGKTAEAAERARLVSNVHSEAFKGFVNGEQFAIMANAEKELKLAGLL